MQKLLRTAFTAVVALGVVACGDDVTVTPPPAPPTPGVNSVTVSPASQTINVGQEVVFAAAVAADAGVTNTSVTWSSSAIAIATVDATTGKVKGITPGTTTIIAKSNHDETRVGVATVTVVSLPPGVTSFNAVPSSINLLVGGTATGQITAVYAPGVTAPAITWSTLNSSVATVNATTGVITAQAPGAAVIRATATLAADPVRGTPAQTVTADINVTVLAAPSISIQSVTQAATTVPVNISNVFGQIEVTLNFNPREQPMDSVVVYLDQLVGAAFVPVAATRQIYNGAIPAAGPLVLSINTANYSKNFTAGTTTTTFKNGQTTVRAAIFRTVPGTPTSIGGPVVANCSVAPGNLICAAPVSMVLNNMDGWAADFGATAAAALANNGLGTKPLRFAQSNQAPFLGLTYWGGPGHTAIGGTATWPAPAPTTDGQLYATLYSVIYTPNRDIAQVTWTVGTASTGNTCAASAELLPGTPAVSTTRPWRRTFGYTGVTTGSLTALAAGQQISCTSHEWTGAGLGDRDNVIVGAAIDNQSNPYVGTLIANNVLLGSTPDSLRLDYVGPFGVTAPQVQGAENFNWVNQNWIFKPSGVIIGDFGVGPLVASWAAFASANGGSNTTFPTVIVNGASPLAETNTNCLLPGGGCDGYTARASATDLLFNASNSGVTSVFGVDRTSPVARYSHPTVTAPQTAYAAGYTGGGAVTVLDSTTYFVVSGGAVSPGSVYGANVATSGAQNIYLSTAAGVSDSFRIEALDNRSGLSRAFLSTVRFAQNGVTGGVTSVCTITNGAFGAGMVDGFRPSPAFHVTNGNGAFCPANIGAPPLTAGYYTSTGFAMDRAGNVSGCPTINNTINGTTGFLASICATAPAPSTTQNTNPAVAAGPGGTNANLYARRTLAIDPSIPLVTGVSPNNNYTGNSSQTFTLGSQDDLEVIDARLRLQYPNVTNGDAPGTVTALGGLVWQYAVSSTVGGFYPAIATRFDNSIIDPRLTSLVHDLFTLNVQETCVAAAGGFGVATGPVTATACGTTTLWNGDPIPQSGAGSIPATKPNNVAVRVRDVFGSFVFNTVPGAALPGPNNGVSAEFISPILPATVAAPGGYSVTYYNAGAGTSCPAGGATQPLNTVSCVSSGINFRHDGGTGAIRNFRAVESLSTTLPIFTRVELYALNSAGEWVFIQRCSVPAGIIPNGVAQSCGAGTVLGTDNGNERYWIYSFTGIPTLPTGTGYWTAPIQFRALGVNAAGFGLFSTRQP